MTRNPDNADRRKPRRTTAGDIPPTIEIDGVSKQFEGSDGTVQALRDIDCTVERGEFVSVVGPSGCGKTTLVRLVGGLDAPTTGTVRVDGEQVTGPGPDRAMVFQEYRLFPWLSVRKNVGFGLVEAGMDEAKRRERIAELLDLIGLAEFATAYPAELSGGMKQRVGLARALAVDPECLLLDEPFASLDAQTRHRLQDELLDIWRETTKTVLFVTHDVEEAVYLSDRVVVLSDSPGQIRDVVDVALPRPRDRTAARFLDRRERVRTVVET